MNKTLTQIAMRHHALFIDIRREDIDMESEITAAMMAFVRRLKENGFALTEELLHAMNTLSTDQLSALSGKIMTTMGLSLNWMPLVKGWTTPTGESVHDHVRTMMVNILGKKAMAQGTTLPCGHLIPEGTFHLERYNGCPFCGQPFRTANYVYTGQGSKLKELRLFTMDDMEHLLASLLTSATPLDATQADTLEGLIRELGTKSIEIIQKADISIKETTLLVVKQLIALDMEEEAVHLLKTPTDILRYLWFEKTGYKQIIEPRTLMARAKNAHRHFCESLDESEKAVQKMKEKLKLRYDRSTCRCVAQWLNKVKLSAKEAAEDMNAKRGMWVRMIHALRLGEYSRKTGFEHLARILDVFYKQDYTTWQGCLNKARSRNDATTTLTMLQQRPGFFARCLFATMLRFGSERTLAAFDDIADQLPPRLLVSLSNAAEQYFDTDQPRFARPITGGSIRIDHNPMLNLFSKNERDDMVKSVGQTYTKLMARHFAMQPTDAKTIYIDPALFNIPISVGDRTSTIQDTSCALMGTRFAVEGDAVRLFLQWGKGLPARHLDMDLSCRITYPDRADEECAFYNLVCTGAKHSGDIQSIPNNVGTAEYIELSLPELEAAGAQYAIFTCNAYTAGTLSPNLVVGWMDSAYPMKVSKKTGVAYDPSCVQHMVRISENDLSKGLVFGVLDIARHEIVWLEMPFTHQTLYGVDNNAVEALLLRLKNKASIGDILMLKAEAQHLAIVNAADMADKAYTYEWALNPADVVKLLYSDYPKRITAS
ncbi:MAG: hypothetical protein IJ620_05840 [Bacteroidales bacterium]|nr:hypothetical protein [Bacteroidales bacterium]